MGVRIRVRLCPRPVSRPLLASLALCLGSLSLLVSTAIAVAAKPVPQMVAAPSRVIYVESAVAPHVGLVSLPGSPRPHNPQPCAMLPHAKLDRLIREAAERHGVSSILLLRVILQESGGRPCAVSTRGAIGLMGLMPATARHFGVQAASAEQNIDAGARYLRILLDKYGNDLHLALAAYNAGPGRVERYRGVPPFRETRNYVARILGE